jgi:G3E family GTPase
MLLHAHGDDILRVKGILNVAGASTPVVVHGVQHLVHPPSHLDAWPDADRRSRIVFITRDIPRTAVERSLAAFIRLFGPLDAAVPALRLSGSAGDCGA